MRRAAFWAASRDVSGVLAAAVVALLVAGCSTGSRFDSISFASDPNTTAALPVPSESVYSPGDYQSGRLPQAQATPAAYSPGPNDRRARYYGAPLPPPQPAIASVKKPSGARVKVEQGDTLSSLSRRYGVPVDDIMAANDLPDARLRIGQQLLIPGAKAQVARASQPKPTAPKPVTSETSVPEPEAAPEETVAEAEESPPPAGPDSKPDVRVVKTTPIPAPGASAPETETNSVKAAPEITGKPKPSVASNDQLPAPDPMSGNSFRWPVKGRVISGFGTKPDGGHNDGINLSVPQGTSVMAAENGVVAYSGSELKGYGNLVLVRHSNNWVSAYAHNDELLVKRGEKVRRGQVIAKAGASGSVSQPQVHFELRKGSRPVDPTKYMSDATAASGN
jgi:murein DD-endopeptidase MepM/ murein hydrolase activator NlpD